MWHTEALASRPVLWLLTALASLGANPAPAAGGEQAKLYDDSRVSAWAQAFLAGNREQVLQAVEADLKGSSTHPFAPHVWTVTQASRGRLEEAWTGLNEPRLREALGPLPEIYRLYRQGRYKEALAQYPPSRAGEIEDPWALTYLAWSA